MKKNRNNDAAQIRSDKESKHSVKKITVKNSYAAAPLPVLRQEHILEGLDAELCGGELLHLFDKGGRFIAAAYYGVQNKAIGWIISKQPLNKLDTDFFIRKFENAFSKRLGMLQNPKTNVFRIFNGEGDGFGGLTIDYYDANMLVNYYSNGAFAYRKSILAALKRTADAASITEKLRVGENPTTYADPLNPKSGDFVVLENGVKCLVNLESGGMTGIFMDQREVRKAVRNLYSKNRRVLNLFSYSALFSVFAALGGAKSTTNIDIAKRSHEIARANFKLNGLDASAHSFLTDDAFDFLDSAAKQGQKYDLIIIDPPSFSTSKSGTFSSEKGLKSLIEAALAVAAKNSVIVVSTNNSKISKEKFRAVVSEKICIEKEFSVPADYRVHREFPESDYLKVAVGTPLQATDSRRLPTANA